MALDEESARSRIVATPRSNPGRVSQPPSTPGPADDDGTTQGRKRAPLADGDPLGKSIVKRALFPGRSQPVQIGRFTVLKLLGQGGMGYVYACYDDALERKVAVKVLRTEMLRDHDTAKARLLREAQAMARLSHPNIVTVHEVGQADDVVYVAMEFVHGTSLDAWIRETRPWKDILAAFVQAGRGLAAAHRAGIIHRDFKPQNTMITEDGLVKVLDFGLARAADGNIREEWLTSQEDGHDASNSNLLRPLTRTGMLLGTPAYMSPEQHRGEPATAASDQFSFCVSLYQSLYGALPFSTASLEALRDDVLRGSVSPAPLRSPVPPRIFNVLRRGMMARPDDRFPSMDALVTELERDPGRLLRRTVALAGTAALASVISVSAFRASEVEVCPDARVELSGIWDAGRASAIEAALERGAGARASEAVKLIEPQLERFATDWVAMRNEACRAHAEGRQSPNLFDLRTSCLDQRRASLDALVDAFVTTDGANLNNLIQAVASLPPLDGCANVEALTAAIPPPGDPEVRARVQRHRETLARAEVYENTAQTRRGLEIVETVLADAKASAYEPLIAEVHLRKASLQVQNGDLTAALDSFNNSLWAALATGHAQAAAEASARRGFLFAHMLRDPVRAQGELPMITALNRRVKHDIELYSGYLTVAGGIHMSAGDWSGAAKRWEEAVRLREQHGRLETPHGIGVLLNLGVYSGNIGRYSEANSLFQRVIAASEKISGSRHPDRVLAEIMRSYNLVNLGRPQEALRGIRSLQSSRDQFESKQLHQLVEYALAHAELAAGNVHEARLLLDHARQLSPESFSTSAWGLLMFVAAVEGDVQTMEKAREAGLSGTREKTDLESVEFFLLHGRALAALGRHVEAVAVFADAKAALASSSEPVHILRSGKLSLEIGRTQMKLGGLDAAEQDLHAAYATIQRVVPPGNPELADAMLALGQLALERRRFDEAVQWLTKAEETYAAVTEPDYPPLKEAQAVLARGRAGGLGAPAG